MFGAIVAALKGCQIVIDTLFPTPTPPPYHELGVLQRKKIDAYNIDITTPELRSRELCQLKQRYVFQDPVANRRRPARVLSKYMEPDGEYNSGEEDLGASDAERLEGAHTFAVMSGGKLCVFVSVCLCVCVCFSNEVFLCVV